MCVSTQIGRFKQHLLLRVEISKYKYNLTIDRYQIYLIFLLISVRLLYLFYNDSKLSITNATRLTLRFSVEALYMNSRMNLNRAKLMVQRRTHTYRSKSASKLLAKVNGTWLYKIQAIIMFVLNRIVYTQFIMQNESHIYK